MANFWWLTPEGAAAAADPTAIVWKRGYTQEKGVAIALGEAQPAGLEAVVNECVRAGVRCDGRSNRSLSNNVSFYLWQMKGRGLVAAKLAGGGDARRRWRQGAAAEADPAASLLRAAVEPIGKGALLTAAAKGASAEGVLDLLIGEGRIVVFARSGKLMAAVNDMPAPKKKGRRRP